MKKTTIKQLLFTFALLMGGASSAWADMPDNTFIVNGTEFTKLYSNDYESDDAKVYGLGWSATDLDRSAATSGYALKTTVSAAATFTVAGCASYPVDMTQSLFYVEMALHNRYYNTGRSVTVTFYSGENVLFTAKQDCANGSSNVFIYDGTTSGTRLSENITSNSNNSAVEASAEVFHRYLIEYDGTSTYLTITSADGTTELARTKLTNAGNVTKITTTLSGSMASRSRIFFDNMWIGSSTAAPFTNHSYTINYKLNGAGEPVKTVTGVSVHNASIDTEASFFVGSQKYYRKDGEATSVTIDKDDQVANIAVRYAGTWNYTVSQQVSSVEKGTKNGTFIEGESFDITWPRYILDETTLYDYNTSGSADYRTTVSPSDDGYGDKYSVTKNYDADTKTDVVLFKESDEIVDATNGVEGGIGNRFTNGSAAKAASAVTAFSLKAGTYKIVAGLIGQNVSVTFTAGETTLMSQSHTSNTRAEYESGVFKLSSTTDIKFTGSSSTGGLDYVYVQSVASDEIAISAVDELGYTYSSKSALDFTGTDIEAYIATYTNGNEITLHQVNKVPANTGLFIKGTADDVSVLAVGETTDNVTGNVLVAQSTTGKVAQSTDTKTNYVLGLVSGTPTFLKVPTEGQEVAAGKAYLSINYSSGSELSSRMNIVFEDEATGISDATRLNDNEKMINDNFYDLSGRKVAQPTKGLYIVNGKKVVIK